MNTRLPKQEIYRVTDLIGIARRCDWFIHDRQFLKCRDTDQPRTIFLSNYRGYNALPFFVNTILPQIKAPFRLIIASEDYTFPTGSGDCRYNHFSDKQDLIAPLLENPYLEHVFVENLDTVHPMYTPIPLGILQYATGPLYQPLLKGIPINLAVRPTRVFCCQRDERNGLQWDDRKKVRDFCKGAWAGFTRYIPQLPPVEFRKGLIQSQFCLCVHGGGIDPSPRAWESLLCGSIPILKHSALDEAYGRFPVVYVDDWTEDAITPEKLDAWLTELRPFYEDPVKRAEVLRMLTLDYWWDIITGPLKKVTDDGVAAGGSHDVS